jgi:hypothetical protein
MSVSDAPLEIVISYAHRDQELKDDLILQLSPLRRQGFIAAWHDRDINAGDDRKRAIDIHFNAAGMILLLVSPDFIASDYCYEIEMKKGIGPNSSRLYQVGRSCATNVGVSHGVELNGEKSFFTHVHLHGGTAPVRRFLPELINLVWNGKNNPGKVFDLTLPLDQVAEGYRANGRTPRDQDVAGPVSQAVLCASDTR